MIDYPEFVYVECKSGECERPHDPSYEASTNGVGYHRHKVPAVLKLQVQEDVKARAIFGQLPPTPAA